MTEKEKANQKAYRQRPEVKEKMQLYRQQPEVRAYIKSYKKSYNLKPEVREKKRLYAQRPEIRARQKKYIQRPEVKAHRKVVQKAYHQKPEFRQRERAYSLRKNYGLTQEAFAALLAGQGGVCAVCGTSEWGKIGPVVDHDHDSGVIRGILCHGCNAAIGLLRNSPQVIRATADYLEKNKC